MPFIIGYDEAKKNVRKRKSQLGYFVFDDQPEWPHAQLNGHDANGEQYFSAAHFHELDQFQVSVNGKFKIGRHELTPYCVHFTRAYTPYGPLVSDCGFAFMVMRAHHDKGKYTLSKGRELLQQVPDRQPWQVSQKVTFPPIESRSNLDVVLEAVPNVKDDQGLAAYTLVLKPNVKTHAPDPSVGDGQYLMILKGSVWHESTEHKSLGLIFVKPDEGPFYLQAGAEGLEALVLNFPQTTPRVESAKLARGDGLHKWQCELCSFGYDEAAGMPEEGIAPGTPWEDVPESWSCPDCSTSKSDFRMVKV